MAKNIAVVCDSAADFPPGMIEQLGVHILPVHILAEGKDHLHGKTITNKDVLKKLRKKKDVSTSPFYPYECTKLFDNLLKRYDEVVSLHLSRELSGNYKSAWSAREFMGEQDAKRVHVLDLGSVTVSLSLLVKKAVEFLRNGLPPASLKDRLAPFQQNAFMVFTVDNLVWLKKGGRVNALEAFLGNMLSVKPIIQLKNARLEPVERHRGKKQALSHMVSMAEENHQKYRNCETWMAYAGNLEEAMLTREKLAAAVGQSPETILLAELGASIATHTGPGSVFIAMIPRQNGKNGA